jgi:hypothetical protein
VYSKLNTTVLDADRIQNPSISSSEPFRELTYIFIALSFGFEQYFGTFDKSKLFTAFVARNYMGKIEASVYHTSD